MAVPPLEKALGPVNTRTLLRLMFQKSIPPSVHHDSKDSVVECKRHLEGVSSKTESIAQNLQYTIQLVESDTVHFFI